jgi:O-succinylbenzoate synthase
MIIERAEVVQVRLPLRAPYRTSFAEVTATNSVFVRLFEKSGLIGVGESAGMPVPVYEPDFIAATVLLLRDHLLPRVLGRSLESVEDLEAVYADVRGHSYAKAAMEAAYWHLVMQETGQPLRTLWGGVRDTVPVGMGIGLQDGLEDSIAHALRQIDEFSPARAKLKIHHGVDVELVRAVREAHPDLIITVDANACYTYRDAEVFLALDEFGLEMIEQPLQYDDFADHARLQAQLSTPICLDESVANFHGAEQALELGACRIINIKPPRVGGYAVSKRIADLAVAGGAGVWCGSMLESGWGQLFNASIATLPGFDYESEIGPSSWYLAEDIVASPLPHHGGYVDVAAADDLWVLDEERFDAYVVERYRVEPAGEAHSPADGGSA